MKDFFYLSLNLWKPMRFFISISNVQNVYKFEQLSRASNSFDLTWPIGDQHVKL